ncbi:MAG: hypothetical protein NC131_19710, partial [Roseburia sp.]|nr:hypothetical protein [Roseburia sp.]
MKKKLFIGFFILASVTACALSFSACNLFGEKDENGGHTHTIVYQSEKASTCAEEGNKEYWYCNSCGEYFSDENGENKTTLASLKTEKLPHTEVTDAAVPKTCTTDGKTEGKHCSVCNEVTVPQTTVKAGHFEVVDKGKEATCTADGLTDSKHCNTCGKVTLAQTVIPARHTLQTDKGKEATCTENGYTDGEHCTKCDYVKAQTVIPAKGHTEVADAAVAATCTTDGKTEGKHCSVCNTVTVTQQTIPAAHKAVTDAAVAATCTSTGKTEGKHCSVCNTVLVEQKLIPITHSGNGALCDKCEALLVPASVGLNLTPITANAASFSGYAGTLNIVGYEVSGRGTCTDANVVIPATYNGLPVLGIGLQAFMNDTILTSIVFPSGFQYIGTEV